MYPRLLIRMMLDFQLKLRPHQQLHLQVLNPLPTFWTRGPKLCLSREKEWTVVFWPSWTGSPNRRDPPLLVHRTRPPYHMCK